MDIIQDLNGGGGLNKLSHEGGWCLSRWQPQDPLVDTGSEGSGQVEKEAFQVMLIYRSPESIERYWLAKRAAAGKVTKVKAQVWEEFGEAMKNYYWTASKLFWQTIQHLRRGQQDGAQAILSKGGETLSSTGEIVERWKEHFE